jgi:hypothetical protein
MTYFFVKKSIGTFFTDRAHRKNLKQLKIKIL